MDLLTDPSSIRMASFSQHFLPPGVPSLSFDVLHDLDVETELLNDGEVPQVYIAPRTLWQEGMFEDQLQYVENELISD